MTDLIAEIDALAEGWDTSKFWVDACGPHSNSRDYVIAVVKAYPQLREMARDAERLDWLDSHPDADVRIAGYGSPRFHGKTLRESIDAAMQGGDK